MEPAINLFTIILMMHQRGEPIDEIAYETQFSTEQIQAIIDRAPTATKQYHNGQKVSIPIEVK